MKVARHPNISPLFQVMFNLLSMYDEEISLADAIMEKEDRRGNVAQFDLSLHVYESKKTLNCVLEYNINLFKRDRIERMAEHFQELVKSLMKHPDQKIRKIPILSSQEKNRVLKEWNTTKTCFQDDKCIHQLFEEQVIKSPLSIAIQDDHHQVTYRELNEKANQLARYIHQSGAVEGSLIAICADRTTDLLVALLAVMKSGCTYIPLDPIYPKDRLALIMEDGKPVIVLTEKKLIPYLPTTDAKYIFIEETAAYANESSENPEFNVSPETIAYLIYTSGSTGKPKGVQIQQRGLVNLITSMAKKPGISSQDLMLAVTTISFDIAVLELYLPILYGAGIVIATQETSMNPELLIKKIEECHPTILQATPVTFRMLNSSEWKGLKTLKIICGGEALPKELAYDLIHKCKELWNGYGPTETSVYSTFEKVEIDEYDRTGYVNIGKPINNTFVYVLNTEFQPVPIGYPGELFIGGDGLGKGYFNLPEMTSEKFLPDPYSPIPGARMYRTGDLVLLLDNGKLEFLNRVDSQVKIRGFRIELGEIESVLT
ncbi:MAG: amino acid adenylation domain-containing protein, partial [Prolixibacteraceae bacterium]